MGGACARARRSEANTKTKPKQSTGSKSKQNRRLGGKLTEMASSDVFISAAANRSSHAADWASIRAGAEGQGPSAITVLAYGSSRSIALAYNFGDGDSNFRGVSELLPTPFTSAVTTVKYLREVSRCDGAKQLVLVAGAGNGQAAIFTGEVTPEAGTSENASKRGDLWKPMNWKLATTLKGAPQHQQGTVQAIGVSSATSSGSSTIAIGTSDGTITVWSVGLSSTGVDASVAQVISSSKNELAGALPLDIAFTSLVSSSSKAQADTSSPSPLLMATASTDRKIVFWIQNDPSSPFTKVLTLSGHDDWVRSLDFSAPFPLAKNAAAQVVELASGSQDGSVRLWRLRPYDAQEGVDSTAATPTSSLDAFERLAKQVEDEANQNNDATGAPLSNKTHVIGTSRGQWAITFDALLTGHEAWVSGVRWHPPTVGSDGQTDQPAALLSASVDNSIIFWTPSGIAGTSSDGRLAYPSLNANEATSSLWLPAQRFGELGVAGAGALGMFGALWNPEWHSDPSRHLVASHAWAGAVHLWGFESNKWTSRPAITGHHLPVKSARWSPNGDWFLTASLDRTARLFGEHVRRSELTTWHELARPQTHGYDIMCASWLDNLSFASAADEKVSRVFAAPQGFVQSAKRLGAVRSERSGNATAAVKSHNILAISLPTAAHAEDISYLKSTITHAARETARSRHSHLYILICSSLFNGGELKLSFQETESLLRSCYGFAWAAAVKEGNLLCNTDVLLVGETVAQETLRKYGSSESGVDHLWTLEGELRVSGGDAVFEHLPAPSGGSATAASASDASSREPFPRHKSIALGGTFDHLHVGHKILLSMAALVATDKIIVGVTGDSMLAKKSNPQLLESIDERRAAVNDFLAKFRSTTTPLQQDVVELADVCGPAGSEADLEALLVTDETLSGAETIAKTRSERGLSGLSLYTIGVVGAGGETDVQGNASQLAAAKVGSTAIREWLAKQSPSVQAKARRQRRRLDRTVQKLQEQESRPMAASVPALGLSNRAVFDGQAPEAEVNELGRKVEAPSSEPVSSVFTRPPVEEELLVSTLWPELDKLYGHGYELLSADSSLDGGRLTATSCKSTSSEHAVVRVYDRANNWKEIAALPGHSLTITRIRFSPDSKYILTVSRDRSWRLFVRRGSGEHVDLVPFAHKEAAHARIIWDAAWTDDGKMFATASRDKSVKVWRIVGNEVELVTSITRLPDAATAVAFDERERLAVGLENGTVMVFHLVRAAAETALQQILTLPRHHATVVNELGWRPVGEGEADEDKGGSSEALLLSCGEDGAVRLVRISSA